MGRDFSFRSRGELFTYFRLRHIIKVAETEPMGRLGGRRRDVTENMKLSCLEKDKAAVICLISHPSPYMERRLCELGFTVGASVRAVGRSFTGGMGAYFVMGAVIALRDSDASAVTVTPDSESHGGNKDG